MIIFISEERRHQMSDLCSTWEIVFNCQTDKSKSRITNNEISSSVRQQSYKAKSSTLEQMIQNLNITFTSRAREENLWKKDSCFFSSLFIEHLIDYWKLSSDVMFKMIRNEATWSNIVNLWHFLDKPQQK